MSKNIKVTPWPPFKRSGTTITQRTAGDSLDLLAGSCHLNDDAYFLLGNTLAAPDAGIAWNTAQTVDALYVGLSAAQNTFIIGEYADRAYDFAHGAQTNPTLYIQSAAQSATEFAKLNAGVLTFGLGIATVAGQYSIGRNADATNIMQFEVPTGATYEWSVNDVAVMTLGTTGNLGLTGQINGVTAAGASLDIIPTTGKYVRIGDATTTSHTLNANDDLEVTGKLEVDSDLYADGRLYVSGNGISIAATGYLSFATNPDDTSSGFYEVTTGNPNLNLWLGTTLRRSLVIGDGASRGGNFDHPAQNNPTLFLHSTTSPEVNNRQFVSWYNDGENSYHLTGTGGHRFGFEALPANATMTFTANPPDVDNSVIFTVNTGTLSSRADTGGANLFVVAATLSATLDNLVTAYNLIAGTGVTAHKYGSTVVFEANATGTAANAYVTTETADTGVVYSFDGAVMSGGRAFSGLFDLQPGQATIVAATPIFGMKDTDCTDYLTDTSAQIYATATDTGSGTEDVDVLFQQQIAGVMTTYLSSDADGNLLVGYSGQTIQFNTSILSGITTLGIAGDLTDYEAVNDGSPSWFLGSAAAERLEIQAVYNAGAQTLDYIQFQTATAGATGKGVYKFGVDGTDVMTIVNGGITVANALTGAGIDLNITSTSYTTLIGGLDVVRSGAITGVNGETMIDLNIAPNFTLTEPGAGMFTYRAASVDLANAAVTAGAGGAVLVGLYINAGTDADATANYAVNFVGNSVINGNVGIGAVPFSWGANSADVLGIINGTPPAAHVDNEIQIYSVDSSDATATLGLMLEQQVEAIGTFTESHKVKVLINGTEYWISLDAVAP